MKSFKEYLTESKKTYDFRIKIAGDLPEGADSMMKTALEKYGVENYKKLASTMVQEHPLDFPQLKNMSVNVFETSLNYPTTQEVLRDYLCDYLDINHSQLKVKKPGEPTEEYQETKQGEYETKLIDGEVFVIVIFPVESTVPLTLRLLPIVVIPAIETPPCL